MDKFLTLSLVALSMGIVSLSLSIMFRAALEGISRNPSSEEKMSKYIFVGAGFIEALGLFCFILGLLLIFG